MKVGLLHHDAVVPADAPVPFRAADGVTTTKRGTGGAPPSYFVKTPGDEVLEFGQEEYFLWRSLDGHQSFAAIQEKFTDEFGAHLSREHFDEFLSELVKSEIVETVAEGAIAPAAPAGVLQAPPVDAEAKAEAAVFPARGGIDPAPALRALAWLGGPLRRFRWLLWPAVIAALVGLGLQAPAALGDLLALDASTAAVLAAIGLVVTGLVPKLAAAAVAAFYGCPPRSCRLALGPGLRPPRLQFDETAFEAVAARGIAIAAAAPLMARLALFAGGTLCWIADGATGDVAAVQTLVIGQLALASFLISSAPLWPSDGRAWLGVALGEPAPLRRAGRSRSHVAVAVWLWTTAVVAVVALYAAPLLALAPSAIGGAAAGLSAAATTVAMAIKVFVAVAGRLWLRRVNHDGAAPRIAYRRIEAAAPGTAPARAETGVIVPFERDAVPAIAPAYRPIVTLERSLVPVIVLAVAAALVESVAFVPYPYEAGGYFTILPHDSSQLNARVAGELSEVLINEGDEVEPGQILGMLSNWQQKYNLEAAKAQLQSAEANLQNLLHSPQPEAIELARTQYEAALARLPYDKAQFARYAALVTNDNVSRANYDQVLSQYQQDQAAAEVARANYDQVRAGTTPDQIEAARAQVRQAAGTVAFNEDELERTRIRATSYGKMVTPNPMLLRGKWFAQGALVFTVEDHRVVQADVQVPETDIDNVRLGGPVRLRLWGAPERTAIGKSIGIAPDALTPSTANPQDVQSGSSNVVRVLVEVPNPNGLLHPQTDGYAKMSGYYMPTWKAFGQLIERFVLVEIWSWIP
jgi:multidrug resistance efflux pump